MQFTPVITIPELSEEIRGRGGVDVQGEGGNPRRTRGETTGFLRTV